MVRKYTHYAIKWQPKLQYQCELIVTFEQTERHTIMKGTTFSPFP